MTQGKGEYSMTYLRHAPVLPNVQKEYVGAKLPSFHRGRY